MSLEGLREQRDDLWDATVALEHALSAPVRDGIDDWIQGVRHGLDSIRVAFDAHVRFTEGDGGVFDEIVAEEPALVVACDRLRRDHTMLGALLSAVSDRLDGARDRVDAEEVRSELLDLIRRFSVHRQRGADLLYEAFDYDVSGGD